MTVTVQQIVDQVRILSDLKRNLYYSDTDISEFIDDAGKELADIFIDAQEHYFQSHVDFTLAGGQGANTLTLPDDFQKADILLRDPTTDQPSRVPKLGSELERTAALSSAYLYAGAGRRYFIADQTLELLPPSMASGNYRLLYTPQFASLAFPRTPTFTVPVAAIPGTVGAGFSMIPSGAEPGTIWTATTDNPWILNGVTMSTLTPPYLLLTGRANPAENGVFVKTSQGPGTATLARLTTVTGFPGTVLPAKGQTILVTGGTVGAGYYIQTNTPIVLDTDAINIVPPFLPAALTPWQRYLKVYGALTVRRGRRQPAIDLQAELETLKKRAAKAAANRTEEPKQAPITRGRAYPFGGTFGSGSF